MAGTVWYARAESAQPGDKGEDIESDCSRRGRIVVISNKAMLIPVDTAVDRERRCCRLPSLAESLEIWVQYCSYWNPPGRYIPHPGQPLLAQPLMTCVNRAISITSEVQHVKQQGEAHVRNEAHDCEDASTHIGYGTKE